jgi:hypothetical protein
MRPVWVQKKVVANQEGVVLGRQHDSSRRYSVR